MIGKTNVNFTLHSFFIIYRESVVANRNLCRISITRHHTKKIVKNHQMEVTRLVTHRRYIPDAENHK